LPGVSRLLTRRPGATEMEPRKKIGTQEIRKEEQLLFLIS